MPTVRLSIAASSKETGALLMQYLEDRGVNLGRSTTHGICYGGSIDHTEHVLNQRCNTDKITRMEAMQAHGVRTVPWFSKDNWDRIPARALTYPLLARKSYGFGGTDIVPIFQPEELPWRIAAGWDWFSQYIPVRTEYRVWLFQGECIGMYEKVMQRPADYKYIGRNFRNGFEFQQVVPLHGICDLGDDALRAIGLDFGAVDILVGMDNQIYVLEVNTAPGVLASHAEPTLAILADRMTSWVRHTYVQGLAI
jgi:glutathione synthase/RimK-type ligase-like ATP-grasp enzyme